MKMILTSATTPDAYVGCLGGWQRTYVAALRADVLRTGASLEERLKWGHLVFFDNGPVLLIRAEPARVLLGFWRGKSLGHIEPRLKPAGKYEMATLKLKPETVLDRDTVIQLVAEAVSLNRLRGDPTTVARVQARKAP